MSKPDVGYKITRKSQKVFLLVRIVSSLVHQCATKDIWKQSLYIAESIKRIEYT